MKFITNDRRECGDLIILQQRHEIATSLYSSQQMRRNKADGVLSTRLNGKKCRLWIKSLPKTEFSSCFPKSKGTY